MLLHFNYVYFDLLGRMASAPAFHVAFSDSVLDRVGVQIWSEGKDNIFVSMKHPQKQLVHAYILKYNYLFWLITVVPFIIDLKSFPHCQLRGSVSKFFFPLYFSRKLKYNYIA